MTENEEIVYLAVNSSSTVYHTNPNCRYVANRHRERNRELADAWDYELCEVCKHGSQDAYTPDDQSTNAIEE